MHDKSELRAHFEKIEELGMEIKTYVPIEQKKATEFRADLAGLLTVSIASTYESCVKEILQNYAYRHNDNFGIFASNNYEKINSKINIKDLHEYAKIFHPKIEKQFKETIKRQQQRVKEWTKIDIIDRYTMILKWRHSFAHAGKRNTTVEEALTYHRYAKHVLLSFSHAFDSN